MKLKKKLLGISAALVTAAMLFNGCSSKEQLANELYVKAFRLIESGKKAEKSSYRDALNFYEDALKEASRIHDAYPSTQLAVDLATGKAKIGPHSLEQLKEKVIPNVKLLAEAEKNPYESAVFVAKRARNSYLEAKSLTGIAGEYARAGDKNKAIKALGDSLKAAEKIDNAQDKAWILAEIATVFAEAGQVDRAVKLAKAIEDPYSRAWALGEVAKVVAKTDAKDKAGVHLKQALDSAREIKGDFLKAWSLAEVAQAYAANKEGDKASELLSEAFQSALSLELVANRTKALVKISTVYAEANKLDSALETASYIEDVDGRSDAMSAIAAAHAQAHRFNEALQILDSTDMVTRVFSRVRGTAKVASEMIRAGSRVDAIGLLNKASEELDGVKLSAEKSSAIVDIAGVFAEARYFERAVALADEADDAYSQALIFIKMADEYVRAGKKNEASRLLLKALEKTALVKGGSQKAELLAAIDVSHSKIEKKLGEKAERILHGIIMETDIQSTF